MIFQIRFAFATAHVLQDCIRDRYTEWDEGRLGAELYDYENDPKEFNNLAYNTEYKYVVKELSEILHSNFGN